MLYLIRHGTTTFNSRAEVQEHGERIRGWLDISLDDNGRMQAREAALKLQGKKFVMFHSTLRRAEETANEIISVLGEPLSEPDMGLTPWNIGMINGMILTEAIPLMTRYFDTPLIAVPEGESYSEFYNRWKHTLFKLLTLAKDTDVVAITHSRNMYCLRHMLTNGVEPITFTGYPIPGGIMQINPATLTAQIV